MPVIQMKMRITGLLVLMTCFGIKAISQNGDIGAVSSVKKIPGGVEGKTASAQFDIHIYSQHIIRVRVSQKNPGDGFSYALSNNSIPDSAGFDYSDQSDSLILSTQYMSVIIQKKPSFRVIFKNKKGEIINEDMPGRGFGTAFTGDKLSLYKKLQPDERFVGLGEALGNLDRRGSGVTLNNTDNYKYGDPRIPMYCSIPFYIGVLRYQVYGLFFNNSYKTFFNFGLSTPGFTSINAEGGDADYFFMYDSSIAKVIEHYTSMTGRMPLPPLWSLGYHQSRCSYYPQDKVKIIAETFRRKNIPIDCIVLDADYLQEYEPFRINEKRFPDMPGLARTLAEMNIELTASINPGIKMDSSYEAYHDGLKKDVFVKYADGSLFISDIAPSTDLFPDFTRPATRNWWIDKMKFLPDNGIHGYWNDMNEPAVGGSYLPDNLAFDFDGRKAGAPRAKNLYGMLMARSSYESAIKYGNNRRPFVLTRSGFAGVQRYSAVWSGDNQANDAHLLMGELINAQMGLSGVPFVGPDLGGYIGDGNKELYKRWIEVGVFSPFLRNHREFFGAANEPWAYGEEAEAISKSYIGFRYRLMPYLYSKFQEASRTGMPIARSLCINYPHESRVYLEPYQYQFLFGDAILVVPVTSQEKLKKVFLPEGSWYDLFSDQPIEGDREMVTEVPAHKIPLYIKSSSIIPMQSLVQSTREAPSDTLFLHIYNGRERNSFVHYEDDGSSMQFKKGEYCIREIQFNPAEKQIVILPKEGNYPSHFKYLNIVLHGFNGEIKEIKTNTGIVKTDMVRKSIFDPLSELEDYYDNAFMQSLRSSEKILPTNSFIIKNNPEKIELNY
jgi:alpha-glucosidase